MRKRCRHKWRKVTRVPICSFFGKEPTVAVYHCKNCESKKLEGPFFAIRGTSIAVRTIEFVRAGNSYYSRREEKKRKLTKLDLPASRLVAITARRG